MPENAFQFFLGRKNAKLVKLLEENTEVSEFFQGILEELVAVADKEGVPYSRLGVRDAFIHAPTKTIRAQVVLR
jgi:ketopantoate reductase